MEQKQKSNKTFIPKWIEEPPKPESYRSIFKWGAPDAFKHPNKRFLRLIMEAFNLANEDFSKREKEGNETVRCDRKVKLSRNTIAGLRNIAGNENVKTDDYSRVKYSFGKTVEEATKLRNGTVERAADVVVHPRDKEDVRKIVAYCNKKRVPVYVYGGGSSVTFGLRPSKGGVALVMNTHMNKLIELNETNQTARVQPGLMGPAYEDILNNAPENLGAGRRYTCGHFPQSFEYSSVGGWVVTLGSGQASSYYGDAYNLVVSQEYVTPAGTIKTLDYPATATGPKINDIMKGNEGTFGICVELTMKIFRYMPKNRQRYAFMFPTWEEAVSACREIVQGEFGMPAVFRISDPEETDVAMKMYGIAGTVVDTFMKLRGFKPMERCMLIGTAEGQKDFAKNVKRQAKKICKRFGGMYLTGYAVSLWEHGRYSDPYMREDLQDHGIMIDTLESGVTWSNIISLHKGVRAFVKNRPQTICMTHASHFYPQGTNLYFIFIAKMKDIREYIKFQDGIIDNINKYGGSLSHHHGVGKMIAPWMEKHLGREQMAVLRALKRHFDPNNIMNPGGQLGLDTKGSEWRKIK